MDFLIQLAGEVFRLQLENYQLLLLQATGVVGILAILLIFRGKSPLISQLGILLGLANLLLFAIVEEWLQGPINPFLRNDLLFIAGFFGGWRSAGFAFSLTLLGRFIFSGAIDDSLDILLSTIDISFVAFGAALLGKVFRNVRLENVSYTTIAKLIFCRYPIVIFPLLFIYLIGLSSYETFAKLAMLRFSSNFSISILVIFTVILMLRREIIREQQVYLDMISTLPNRRALQKNINEAFHHAQREKDYPSHSLLLIEVANLSDLIQEHDHDWVDKFLHQFGHDLESSGRSGFLSPYHSKVYCFSDRSFAVILQGVTAIQIQERGIASHLLGKLLRTDPEGEKPLKMRPTIGVIDIEFDESFSPSWFLRALSSMERNAHAPVHYFEPTITGQLQLEKWLRIQIEQWIEQGEVPMWLQPKIFLPGMYCMGAEALLRVQDDDGRFISPPLVLSVATQHNLLVELEWATIRTVIKQLQFLPEACGELDLSINVSPISLTDSIFAERFCDLLEQSDLCGKHLVIEIIETSQLPVTETVQANIAILLEYGISISLDDFGTGYSSLSLFTKLPFNELKLDYSMISGLHNPRGHAAVMLAAESAKHYSARVVAEGIETEEQCQQLLRMGIEYGQGFLFSKAIPYDDFVEYACKNARRQSERIAPAFSTQMHWSHPI
ncbi:MAG: EAL domain-containing protein [Azovibrio sp.]